MSDDLISRQAAIETFKDCAVNGVGIDGIVDALKQLPPIQPAEPKLVKCDYVKACNKVTMNKTFSALRYLAMLDDFEEYGYVLVDMREVEHESN